MGNFDIYTRGPLDSPHGMKWAPVVGYHGLTEEAARKEMALLREMYPHAEFKACDTAPADNDDISDLFAQP